jgi:hypothetical protein
MCVSETGFYATQSNGNLVMGPMMIRGDFRVPFFQTHTVAKLLGHTETYKRMTPNNKPSPHCQIFTVPFEGIMLATPQKLGVAFGALLS